MEKTTGRNESLRQEQKTICSWAMSGALALAVLFIIIGEKPIGKGLLLGTIFSIVNFYLLGKTIPMTLGKSRPKAGFIGFFSILIRYLILAVPMIIALKSTSFNFIAVVAGIFAVQIVTLIDYIIIKPHLHNRGNSSTRTAHWGS